MQVDRQYVMDVLPRPFVGGRSGTVTNHPHNGSELEAVAEEGVVDGLTAAAGRRLPACKRRG